MPLPLGLVGVLVLVSQTLVVPALVTAQTRRIRFAWFGARQNEPALMSLAWPPSLLASLPFPPFSLLPAPSSKPFLPDMQGSLHLTDAVYWKVWGRPGFDGGNEAAQGVSRIRYLVNPSENQ